jgi:hypothetical protein
VPVLLSARYAVPTTVIGWQAAAQQVLSQAMSVATIKVSTL